MVKKSYRCCCIEVLATFFWSLEAGLNERIEEVLWKLVWIRPKRSAMADTIWIQLTQRKQ